MAAPALLGNGRGINVGNQPRFELSKPQRAYAFHKLEYLILNHLRRLRGVVATSVDAPADFAATGDAVELGLRQLALLLLALSRARLIGSRVSLSCHRLLVSGSNDPLT